MFTKALRVALIGLLMLFFAAQAQEATWLTNYNDALSAAKAQNKPVLIYFTGSDWCGWCVKLDKEVLRKDPFITASSEWVLLEVDFPRYHPQSDLLKKQNLLLVEKYGIEGFPTLVFVDAEGKEIRRTGYLRVKPAAFVAHLRSLVQ